MHLGTGDYGHLVVDHSAMLLRHFRSLCKYSGQGFESSHKLHRQLYSRQQTMMLLDLASPVSHHVMLNAYFNDVI